MESMQTAAAASANLLPSVLDETRPELRTIADRVAPPIARWPLQFLPALGSLRFRDLQSPAWPSPMPEDKAAATPSKCAPRIAIWANHPSLETGHQATHPALDAIYVLPLGGLQAATMSMPAGLQWSHNPPETVSALRHVIVCRPSANRLRLARPAA